jgi:hypothetical protein
VKVEVGYQYTMVWPIMFGNEIGLASSVLMRIE